MAKTWQMQCIERARGRTLQELIQEGVAAGRTWDEIAFDLGVTRLTLRDWTRRLGGRVETKRTVTFGAEERRP